MASPHFTTLAALDFGLRKMAKDGSESFQFPFTPFSFQCLSESSPLQKKKMTKTYEDTSQRLPNMSFLRVFDISGLQSNYFVELGKEPSL